MTICVKYQPTTTIYLMVIEPLISNGKALRNITDGNLLGQNEMNAVVKSLF